MHFYNAHDRELLSSDGRYQINHHSTTEGHTIWSAKTRKIFAAGMVATVRLDTIGQFHSKDDAINACEEHDTVA